MTKGKREDDVLGMEDELSELYADYLIENIRSQKSLKQFTKLIEIEGRIIELWPKYNTDDDLLDRVLETSIDKIDQRIKSDKELVEDLGIPVNLDKLKLSRFILDNTDSVPKTSKVAKNDKWQNWKVAITKWILKYYDNRKSEKTNLPSQKVQESESKDRDNAIDASALEIPGSAQNIEPNIEPKLVKEASKTLVPKARNQEKQEKLEDTGELIKAYDVTGIMASKYQIKLTRDKNNKVSGIAGNTEFRLEGADKSGNVILRVRSIDQNGHPKKDDKGEKVYDILFTNLSINDYKTAIGETINQFVHHEPTNLKDNSKILENIENYTRLCVGNFRLIRNSGNF